MNNKATIILALCALLLVSGVVGIGALVSQPPKPHSVPKVQKPAEPPLPSKSQLDEQLIAELPQVNSVILAAFPDVAKYYIVDRGSLYHRGEWYGTTLTYSGDSSISEQRDTLRILLQKVDNVWKIRTNPPQPLLNIRDLPDVPKPILKAINTPTILPGTADSPAITPVQ